LQLLSSILLINLVLSQFHSTKKTAPISIRQLSKTKGSCQGELLEVRQFSEIFADLGYETELVDNIDGTINLDQIKKKCNTAIEEAKPEFKKHRGWHQVSLILRIILGALAMITVIPAIAVEAKIRQGYTGTFFKTPKTDAEEKLELLKQNINNLK